MEKYEDPQKVPEGGKPHLKGGEGKGGAISIGPASLEVNHLITRDLIFQPKLRECVLLGLLRDSACSITKMNVWSACYMCVLDKS